MYYTNHYVIDWDKVQTLEDMKRLVRAINITFEPDFDADRFESIKDLLRLEPKAGYPVKLTNIP